MRELLSASVGPAARRMGLGLTLALIGPVPPARAAECGAALPSAPVLRLVEHGMAAAVAVRSGRLAVGQPLPMLVALCGRGDEALVGFDADMPAHRHGMNYRASWRPDGAQTWAVEGVLLHMPGTWRLIVEVQRGAERLRLTGEVVVR